MKIFFSVYMQLDNDLYKKECKIIMILFKVNSYFIFIHFEQISDFLFNYL